MSSWESSLLVVGNPHESPQMLVGELLADHKIHYKTLPEGLDGRCKRFRSVDDGADVDDVLVTVMVSSTQLRNKDEPLVFDILLNPVLQVRCLIYSRIRLVFV